MSEMRNQEIRDFCEWDFPRWLWSRSQYAPKLPLNILAQYQPSKAPLDRDYDNSPLCAEFYLALKLKMDIHPEKALCFMYVFFPKARPMVDSYPIPVRKPLKVLADELNTTRKTVDDWAHQAAIEIFGLAKTNLQLQELRRDMLVAV